MCTSNSTSTSNNDDSIEDSLSTNLSNFPAGSQHLANTLSSMSIDKGFEPDRRGDKLSRYTTGPNTVIDIGGSHGGLSIILAQLVERVIVQDLDNLVAEGISKLSVAYDRFMAHNLFSQSP